MYFCLDGKGIYISGSQTTSVLCPIGYHSTSLVFPPYLLLMKSYKPFTHYFKNKSLSSVKWHPA